MFQPIDDNLEIDTDYVHCSEYQIFIDVMKKKGKDFRPNHWTTDRFPAGSAEKPISGIQGKSAEEFCQWLTSGPTSVGYQYRLPKIWEAVFFEEKILGTKEYLRAEADFLSYWCNDEQGETILKFSPKVEDLWQKKLHKLMPKIHEQIKERTEHLTKLFSRDLYETTLDTLDKENIGLSSTKSKLSQPTSDSFIEELIKIIRDHDFTGTQNSKPINTIHSIYSDIKSVIKRSHEIYEKAIQQIYLLDFNFQYQINSNLGSQANAKELHLRLSKLLKRTQKLAKHYNRSSSTHRYDVYRNRHFHILLSELYKICNLAYDTYGFDFLRHIYQYYENKKNLKRFSRRYIRKMFNKLIQHLKDAHTLTTSLAQQRDKRFDEFINSLRQPYDHCKLAKSLLDQLLDNLDHDLTLEFTNHRRFSLETQLVRGFSWENVKALLRNAYKDIDQASSRIKDKLSDMESNISVALDFGKDDLTKSLFNFLVASHREKISLSDFHGFIAYINKEFDMEAYTYPDKIDLGFISSFQMELQMDITANNKIRLDAVCSYLLIVYHLASWLYNLYEKYILSNSLCKIARLDIVAYEIIQQECFTVRNEALNLYALAILLIGQSRGDMPVLGGLRLVRKSAN